MACKESEKNDTKQDNSVKPAIILKFKRSRFRKQYGCAVCPSSYTQITNLKYHIRRKHYNLIATITKREKREINEVWLERVVNSDDVIEIKKTGHNKYLMKKSSNPDSIEIADSKDTIDLTPLYPDRAQTRRRHVWCCICKKKFIKADYTKHLEEDHDDLMI